MGHEIEIAATRRGHCIKLIIDVNNADDLNSSNLDGIDVAIDFSVPDVAFTNVCKCLNAKVPVVSGTTGWLEKINDAVELCKKNDTAFIHSSNYSIGVNILFRLNADLARYMSRYKEYNVSIEEIHHIKKLDAPSGTALSLVSGIVQQHPGYKTWSFDSTSETSIPVKSVREGTVPGTHIVTWESEIENISLRHEAKNRSGLALGAVIAAEYISKRKGVFTMNDVMEF